jgi:hypothetical protein
LAFAQEYALVIDGQPVPQAAITVNGEVYLPLAALHGTGAVAIFDGSTLSLSLPGAVVTGGANQREPLEGCLGDGLFNGVWRAKVLSVAPLTGEKPGWGVTLELKNGTAVTLAPVFTGVSGIGEGMHLVLEDGTILPVDPYDVQQLTYASLPQGGGTTHELKFYRPSGSDDAAKPEKFLLEINPGGVGFSEQQAGVAYSTLTPSLRVRLECGS